MKKINLTPDLDMELPFDLWGPARMRLYRNNRKEYEATYRFDKLTRPVLIQLSANGSRKAFEMLKARGVWN